jgi:Rrf2 family protein
MSYSPAYTQAIAITVSISAQNILRDIQWVSAASLSETLGIPKPTVVNITSRLVSAGLLESKEGKNGGLRFCKSPSQVNLLHIMEAIERKRSLFHTDLAAKANRPEINDARRIVLSCFQSAEKSMKHALAEVTIDHFIRHHRQKRDQCRKTTENR